MKPSKSFWNGKRVLLTGHTGFKGGWMAALLGQLGAEVTGLALDPDTSPSLFESISDIVTLKNDFRGDISDFDSTLRTVTRVRPEIVFHLAAQPLVLKANADPLGTIRSNVLGTANMLEAVRRAAPDVSAVLLVTTDKVYQNKEWVYPYRETDALGGNEIYSASKACADILGRTYGSRFLPGRIANVRAGNVIGGGDWAANRLVPDFVRASMTGAELVLRNPGSVRPWQHVLEPCVFYLALAERIATGGIDFATDWNVGPFPSDFWTVEKVCTELARHMPARIVSASSSSVYEAQTLKLDVSKATDVLGWHPRLALTEALEWTARWYVAHSKGSAAKETQLQIDAFLNKLAPERTL